MSETVVITGAGSGIGLAMSQELAARGFRLILLGRNLDRLHQTRRTLQDPPAHLAFACDIRRRESLDSVLKDSGVKALHGVVINAGTGGENHPGGTDRWQEILDTNLTGSYFTAQACLPYLQTPTGKKFRHMVFVASILARLGVPGYTAYCASKAGILGLMRSLASELAGAGVLVNAVCPGWVDTDMAHEGLQAFADALGVEKEEAHRLAMEQVPLRKMAAPGEVARLIAFLFSEAQTSITGQTLDINNGALMP